jgi:hypothetical protein
MRIAPVEEEASLALHLHRIIVQHFHQAQTKIGLLDFDEDGGSHRFDQCALPSQ